MADANIIIQVQFEQAAKALSDVTNKIDELKKANIELKQQQIDLGKRNKENSDTYDGLSKKMQQNSLDIKKLTLDKQEYSKAVKESVTALKQRAKEIDNELKQNAKLEAQKISENKKAEALAIKEAAAAKKQELDLNAQSLKIQTAYSKDKIAEQKRKEAQATREANAEKKKELDLNAQTLKIRTALAKEKQKAEIQAAKEVGYLNQLKVSIDKDIQSLMRMTEEEFKSAQGGQALIKSIKERRAELAKVQQSYGDYSKNVGNYSSATKMLGINLGQVMKEMPNFAISARTGIMSLTNNLPMLAESIKAVRLEQKAMAAQGKKTTSMLGMLGKSVFGLTGIMSIGMVLLQLYNEEIVGFIKGLFNAEDATRKAEEAQKAYNHQLALSKIYIDEMAELQLMDATTNEERLKIKRDAEIKYWEEHDGRILESYREDKRLGIKYDKEKLEELEKLEEEYFEKLSKYDSDLRIAREMDRRDQIAAAERLKDNIDRISTEMYRAVKENASNISYEWMNMLRDYTLEAVKMVNTIKDEQLPNLDAEVTETLKNMQVNHSNWLNDMLDANIDNIDAARDINKQIILDNMNQELSAANLTSEQRIAIEKKAAQAIKEINRETFSAKVDMAAQALSGFAKLFGEESKMGKALAASEVGVTSAQKAFEIGALAAGYYASGNIPMGILATAQAAGVVAGGIAAIRDIYAVDDVNASDVNTSTTTVSEKFHTGGTIGSGTNVETPITALTGESVNTVATTQMFAPLLSSLNQLGGGNAITSNVGNSADGTDMLAAAFSKALKNMPPIYTSWTDYKRMEGKQAKMVNNRYVR